MKRFRLLLPVLCFSAVAHAQVPINAYRMGAAFYAGAYAVAADDIGNTYTAGTFFDTLRLAGLPPVVTAGSGDIFLVKHDPDGKPVWVRRGGGKRTDHAVSVTCSGASVYVSGYIMDTATFGSVQLYSAGMQDGFVARYDTAGTSIWAKSAGSAAIDERMDQVVVEGNYTYVTASISAGSKFNSSGTTLPSFGNMDAYILKLDQNGSLVSYKNLGGTSNDFIYDITSRNGKLYVAGDFSSSAVNFGSVTKSSYGDGQHDGFLACYDTAFANIYAVTMVGPAYGVANQVVVDDSAFAYVSGHFTDTVDFSGNTLIGKGMDDGYVASYSPSGTYRWSFRFGGSGSDEINGIARTPDGNLMIAGSFTSTVVVGADTVKANKGFEDLFIVKLAAGTGLPTWARAYASKSHDFIAGGIASNSNGDFYAAGTVEDTFRFADALIDVAPKIGLEGMVLKWRDVVDLAVKPMTGAFACGGKNLYVPFSLTGQLSADNAFSIYLSDASGAFTPGLPVGSLAKRGADSVLVAIPDTISSSSLYRFRIVANGSQYSITGAPSGNVTLQRKPNKPVITMMSDTLWSSYTTMNQWLLGGNFISGAVHPYYLPMSNGVYQVEVDSFGCKSRSDTFVVMTLSLRDEESPVSLQVYPSPTSGLLTVTGISAPSMFELIGIRGKCVLSGSLPDQNPLDIGNMSDGMYILRVVSNSRIMTTRIQLLK